MSATTGADRHAAAYRLLLGAYPVSYRRDVGEAATDAFRDMCLAARRDAGAWGLAKLWFATAPRLMWGGLSERGAELRSAWGPASDDREVTPPYGWALLAGGLVFALYAFTLAPTTAFWDTSEYIATGHILGIPHPPGNPLFVVLARAWEILLAPWGLSTAVRINLLSAFMSAAAHGLWFLVVHHVLSSFDRHGTFRLGGAFTAVLVSATAFTVWNQSNVNEKVYTVSLFTIALLSWIAIRWQARGGERGADNLLVLMAFILALSVGNHLMAFLAAPAIVVFVAVARPRTLMNLKLYPTLIVAGMVGLTVHLFLPIRAALDPVINQGAPLCDSIGGALQSILSYGRAGCDALSESLSRNQYQKPPVWERQAPLGAQALHYLQYFDWQWSRGIDGARVLLSSHRLPFTALFAGLGVWGAAEHAKRDRSTFWYFLILFATLSAALTFYLNFEYGYSIPGPPGTAVEREVRERDYFFVVGFSVWGLWAGVGISALWLWLSRNVARSLRAASPVLLVAAIPLVLNGRWADRSQDYAARDWAYNLLESVEPYGVLFTAGDNDTFPLWYLQEVEGVRRDVTVIVTEYLNLPWYARQIRDLTRPCAPGTSADDRPTRITCQRDYAPRGRVAYTHQPGSVDAGVVPVVTEQPVKRPDLPIMELDDATIERIGGRYVALEEAVSLTLGEIRPVVPAGQYLRPWQQYALAIVDTAFADARPVYWSNNGPGPSSLGLDPYLVRHGVAFKLDNRDPAQRPVDGVVVMPERSPYVPGTGRQIDVRRTETLLNDVFVHRSDLPHWDHWPDHTTASIPSNYGWAYYALALASAEIGDRASLARYTAAGDAWMELMP